MYTLHPMPWSTAVWKISDRTVMYMFVIYLLYYDSELKIYFSKNLHTGEKNLVFFLNKFGFLTIFRSFIRYI